MKKKYFLVRTISLFMFMAIAVLGLMLSGQDVAFAQEAGLAEAIDKDTDQQTVSGASYIKGVLYVSSPTLYNSTTSTTFVLVPNMSITHNNIIPVIIEYCAVVFDYEGGLMEVDARVDGVPATPGAIQLTGDSDENFDGHWARSHCFKWVAPKVPRGSHTIEIYWRSVYSQTVWTHNRTLAVWVTN
jgi:hypothetical protein